MKKIWKNLCVCAMVAVSAFSMSGCKKPGTEVAVDLDGDGVVSYWEELYEVKDYSYREIANVDVVEISTLAELKAINDNTTESKVYKLAKNIDCGGEEIAINLGSSTLLGNNRIIKNFKLGDCKYYIPESDNELIEGNFKGLIYNGVGIYDLRVFMGHQVITLNNTYNQTIISPFINVSNIDSVEVKGKYTIDRQKSDGLSSTNTLDLSMLNANINELETLNTAQRLNITNSTINGVIVYKEGDTNTRLRVGGVVPYNSSTSEIYKVNTNVNMDILSSGRLMVGSIAGENDNMISTCSTSGEIKTSYTPNFESKIGGIVGSNNKEGEVKNCVSNNTITFDYSLDSSAKPNMYVGGIAGCNYGILDYVTSDSNMNITKAAKCQIGGIAGYSKDAIFNNIISRGNINCTNVSELYVSDMVGVSQNGYISTALVATNINVDNTAINSNVKLGLVTMFENFDIDSKYNAEYAPNFSGILVAGKTKVYMKQESYNSNANSFNYNLGLRNPFEYFVIDENTGEIKQQLVVDSAGNPILDKDGNEQYVNVTATLVPDLYNKLFILESYSLEKFNVTNGVNSSESLAFTYAKDSSNASIVSLCSNSRLQVNFFVRYLGFKYGLNHNEIDLSVMDINKINFTLQEDRQKVKFFEDKMYNGELEYYDRFLDKESTFDSSDEMYSLLNDLIISDKTSEFIPLKISSDYVNTLFDDEIHDDEDSSEEPSEPSDGSQEDGEMVDTSITLGQRLAIIVQTTINNMLKVRPEIYQLTSDKVDINDISDDSNPDVKYMRLSFSDSEYRYYLTFDVSKVLENETLDSYLVFLQYSKISKY